MRRSLAVAGALVVLIVCSALPTSASAATSPCPAGWHRVGFAHPSGGSVFFNDLAVRGHRAWVLGTVNGTSPVIERFNGTRWRMVPSPAIGPNDVLFAIGLVGRRSALVVGMRDFALPLVLRWDGSTWNEVSVPAPPLIPDEESAWASDVLVRSRDDIWLAIGERFQDENIGSTLVHWDGQSWQLMGGQTEGIFRLPPSAPAHFLGAGLEGKDVDFASVARWDGLSWASQPAPDIDDTRGSSLSAIAQIAGDEAWAVGHSTSRTTGEDVALTEHWDGTGWARVPAPEIDPSGRLEGVAELGPRRVWAVGWSGEQPLIDRYDGVSWRSVKLPSRWTGAFSTAAATANGQVWAAGSLIARRCPAQP